MKDLPGALIAIPAVLVYLAALCGALVALAYVGAELAEFITSLRGKQ